MNFKQLKTKVGKKAPDWIYILLKTIYCVLSNPKDLTVFVQSNNLWLAFHRESKLLVPSPKGSWKSYHIDPSVASEVKTGEIVLEIGAAVGAFALSIAHKVNKVIALEPDPKNFACLTQNIRIQNQKAKNIIPIYGAAWSRRRIMKLYQQESATATSLVPMQIGGEKKRSYVVIADTLDTITAEQLDIEQIDYLRINAEGAEYEILKGAQELLKTVKRVNVVYHSEKLKRRCYHLLKKKGFGVEVSPATKMDGKILATRKCEK